MSKRTPYLADIRSSIKNGTLKKPSLDEIKNGEQYEPARSYCAKNCIAIQKMGIYRIVSLNESIFSGLGYGHIIHNVFGCNNLAQVQKLYA